MRHVSLEKSLHILGPVLGRKRGVEVVIGGCDACTDGSSIFLPSLPIDDQVAAILGFGLLFHETNHIRYTDFGVERGKGLVGGLTNALEDIRIDRLGHEEYPGGKMEEENLIEVLIRRGEAKSCKAGDHPAKILESYVMWKLEHEVLGIRAAQTMAEASERLFRDTFPEAVATKLDPLMFGVTQCDSTAETSNLARRIAAMLEEEADAEEQKQQRGEANDPEAGQAGGNATSVSRSVQCTGG